MDNSLPLGINLSNAFLKCGKMNELLNDLSEKIGEFVIDVISHKLEKMAKLLKELIEKYNNITKDVINSYNLKGIHIPVNKYSLDNSFNQPHAPPYMEGSIKDMAIENFNYNINRYKNSRIVSLIKCKGRNFAIELLKAILLSLILKLLGMQ